MALASSDFLDSFDMVAFSHACMASSNGRDLACRTSLRSAGDRPSDLFLDSIQLRDTFKRLFCHRRRMSVVQLEKLSSYMSPACGFDDRAFLVQLVETSIPISLEHAPIVL